MDSGTVAGLGEFEGAVKALIGELASKDNEKDNQGEGAPPGFDMSNAN